MLCLTRVSYSSRGDKSEVQSVRYEEEKEQEQMQTKGGLRSSDIRLTRSKGVNYGFKIRPFDGL